ELTKMAPRVAWKIDGDELEEVDVDELEVGDLVLVKTGGQVPIDGIVIEGEGHVNEASITGESVPCHKVVNSSVYAGTILVSGTLKVETSKVGEDTTFAKIIALVEEAQDAKSPIERFIDKFARYYTPMVVVIAFLVFVVLRDLSTAITVLVLACPGALVIGAPIANVAGIGRGAREGILLKGGDSVHTFAKCDTVVFDKTGTLTVGYPKVVELKGDPSALMYTASLEKLSDHPLAQAITRYAEEKKVTLKEVKELETLEGRGLKAKVEGIIVGVGNARLMEEMGISIPEEYKKSTEGSLVYTAVGDQVVSLMVIKDALREDAEECMQRLKQLGIKKILMLTGDREESARSVSELLKLDEVYTQLLPEDKYHKILELQKEGKNVTFVGDGINDSVALTAADTGIAMGSGTDVAVDCSDVVLIKSDLKSLCNSLALSRRILRILYQNLVIAIGTVIFLLVGLFMGYIHMGIGMLVHEASILVVILNAMRLLIGGKK
ncbi:MAG: cadmium-translocating P-type ATPase, partial [Erysipelotrichaceae bacterium]|nr:cadmium-translocating P-type ATPase [Erysipelotrichaceae bacterium]